MKETSFQIRKTETKKVSDLTEAEKDIFSAGYNKGWSEGGTFSLIMCLFFMAVSLLCYIILLIKIKNLM